jgi:hypothetical protein
VIACGYAWRPDKFPAPQKDVVVIGRGDRAQVDELVRLAPSEEARQQVIDYFKPFVEGGRPKMTGAYIYGAGRDLGPLELTHLWWKPVDKVLP